MTSEEIEKIKDEEFSKGVDEGKDFLVSFIYEWMRTSECRDHMTMSGMEFLREKLEDFVNED